MPFLGWSAGPTQFLLQIDNGDGYVEYTKYLVEESVVIDDQLNQPTLMSFTLSNFDDGFDIPKRSAYVRMILSDFNVVLASGFITQEPEKSYIGQWASPKFDLNLVAFKIAVTSDDWLLNQKSLRFVPAFVNQTVGKILRILATALVPSFFDLSNIDDGDIIPIYKYDPKRQWTEIAKEFADQARFRYKAINKRIYYKPYGDSYIGISYDDSSQVERGHPLFDPSSLQTSIFGASFINDVIVVGDVEPQNIREDNFIGDGISTDFILKHVVFGGQSVLLLTEDWTEANFSNQLWTVIDPDGTKFAIGTGALNVLQGAAPAILGSAYILGVNGLELGGHLDLQHGEIAFQGAGNGILGGVYSDASLSQAACQAGFQIGNFCFYDSMHRVDADILGLGWDEVRPASLVAYPFYHIRSAGLKAYRIWIGYWGDNFAYNASASGHDTALGSLWIIVPDSLAGYSMSTQAVPGFLITNNQPVAMYPNTTYLDIPSSLGSQYAEVVAQVNGTTNHPYTGTPQIQGGPAVFYNAAGTRGYTVSCGNDFYSNIDIDTYGTGNFNHGFGIVLNGTDNVGPPVKYVQAQTGSGFNASGWRTTDAHIVIQVDTDGSTSNRIRVWLDPSYDSNGNIITSPVIDYTHHSPGFFSGYFGLSPGGGWGQTKLEKFIGGIAPAVYRPM